MISGDELAGIVDLFGGLTEDELRVAVDEAAFRAGTDVDGSALTAAIDAGLEAYQLVAYEPRAGESPVDGGDGTLLVAGPRAFPTTPPGSEDLPHIMDVDHRPVDRKRAGESAVERFRRDAAITIDAGDAERAAWLIDVSYDVEAWAPVDLAPTREDLDDVADRDPAAVGSPPGVHTGDGPADPE